MSKINANTPVSQSIDKGQELDSGAQARRIGQDATGLQIEEVEPPQESPVDSLTEALSVEKTPSRGGHIPGN